MKWLNYCSWEIGNMLGKLRRFLGLLAIAAVCFIAIGLPTISEAGGHGDQVVQLVQAEPVYELQAVQAVRVQPVQVQQIQRIQKIQAVKIQPAQVQRIRIRSGVAECAGGACITQNSVQQRILAIQTPGRQRIDQVSRRGPLGLLGSTRTSIR